ncbi:39S ribosomal protein L50-like protein [Leptotrombidium deliense]|uniref:Large ribosomal subunit protein mL50 n=1 Tax=Leptotrombidium deliense TaxID=299467 RepID=A0A443SW00_9ACAR|nr:39S ribosomal protein L50-like protein [Leptotrombidium deliense]
MDSLKQSLLMKGFCRECKPYEPPSDYEQSIKQIAEQVLNRLLPQNWLDTPIKDYVNKFQLLVRCEKVFNHELPNSELHRIETLRDVCEYYSTPVRGINSYDALNRNQQNLPENLHVIPEPISFDPNYFGGLDAYPNSPIIETGLRAKKKYPDLKVGVVWPDV